MAELVQHLPAQSHADEHGAPGFGLIDGARIAVIAAAAVAEWLHLWQPFGRLSPVAVAALAVGGWPIFAEAFENLTERRMTMELSMTIAIVAAAAISEFFTALVITLFVLVAEVLEGMTVSRGRRAIRDMLDFLPHAVAVRRAGAVREVEAGEIAVGEAILIAPGGLIPADGTVLAGHSFVDESRITGESLPVEKIAGAAVFAGSINQSGALELRADRLGRDTSYGKIIEAVERAEQSRAPVQRLADRLAGYLVYFALASAGLTLIVTHDIRSTIAVIIVAGACGIAAGTPLAILGAIGRAARAGAIIKGGLYLETLGRVDTIVLDKTGTLTFGRPELQAILPESGVTEDELLDAAATAELRSEHPLGKAIVAHARQAGRPLVEPDRFAYRPGRGIEAQAADRTILVGNRAFLDERGVGAGAPAEDDGGARVLVARDGKAMGTITVADRLRPEARGAVERLRRMGLRTILLTGDTREAAASVAGALALDEVGAGLLPEEKLARVRALVAGGACVAMVGDGINDAPALAAADVGIAMGSGTDVARECADIVLLGNDLARFVEVVALARRTRRTIWQNFAGTIAVDLVGIALASVGLLGPLLAAFIHVASEMSFILNSARLLPPRRAHRESDLPTHPAVG